MDLFAKSDRCVPTARRPCGPRRAALLASAAVIAAATLPPWPVSVALAQRPEVTENSLGMRFVKIPAGEFEMEPEEGDDNDTPVRVERITRAFLLGETEVTQAQWQKVMDSSPWKGQDHVKEGAAVAATYVSWVDAVEFCARLTKLEQASGKLGGNARYRLPAETEWEYACRAGTKTRWSFGDEEDQLGEFAWFTGNALDKDEKYAHEVGQKRPNPWGLHDMHGNVWEWCSDRYDKEYAKTPAAEPDGPDTGSFRGILGGSWNNMPVRCRSACRRYGAPALRDHSLGFRVVCEVE